MRITERTAGTTRRDYSLNTPSKHFFSPSNGLVTTPETAISLRNQQKETEFNSDANTTKNKWLRLGRDIDYLKYELMLRDKESFNDNVNLASDKNKEDAKYKEKFYLDLDKYKDRLRPAEERPSFRNHFQRFYPNQEYIGDVPMTERFGNDRYARPVDYNKNHARGSSYLEHSRDRLYQPNDYLANAYSYGRPIHNDEELSLNGGDNDTKPSPTNEFHRQDSYAKEKPLTLVNKIGAGLPSGRKFTGNKGQTLDPIKHDDKMDQYKVPFDKYQGLSGGRPVGEEITKPQSFSHDMDIDFSAKRKPGINPRVEDKPTDELKKTFDSTIENTFNNKPKNLHEIPPSDLKDADKHDTRKLPRAATFALSSPPMDDEEVIERERGRRREGPRKALTSINEHKKDLHELKEVKEDDQEISHKPTLIPENSLSNKGKTKPVIPNETNHHLIAEDPFEKDDDEYELRLEEPIVSKTATKRMKDKEPLIEQDHLSDKGDNKDKDSFENKEDDKNLDELEKDNETPEKPSNAHYNNIEDFKPEVKDFLEHAFKNRKPEDKADSINPEPEESPSKAVGVAPRKLPKPKGWVVKKKTLRVGTTEEAGAQNDLFPERLEDDETLERERRSRAMKKAGIQNKTPDDELKDIPRKELNEGPKRMPEGISIGASRKQPVGLQEDSKERLDEFGRDKLSELPKDKLDEPTRSKLGELPKEVPQNYQRNELDGSLKGTPKELLTIEEESKEIQDPKKAKEEKLKGELRGLLEEIPVEMLKKMPEGLLKQIPKELLDELAKEKLQGLPDSVIKEALDKAQEESKATQKGKPKDNPKVKDNLDEKIVNASKPRPKYNQDTELIGDSETEPIGNIKPTGASKEKSKEVPELREKPEEDPKEMLKKLLLGMPKGSLKEMPVKLLMDLPKDVIKELPNEIQHAIQEKTQKEKPKNMQEGKPGGRPGNRKKDMLREPYEEIEIGVAERGAKRKPQVGTLEEAPEVIMRKDPKAMPEEVQSNEQKETPEDTSIGPSEDLPRDVRQANVSKPISNEPLGKVSKAKPNERARKPSVESLEELTNDLFRKISNPAHGEDHKIVHKVPHEPSEELAKTSEYPRKKNFDVKRRPNNGLNDLDEILLPEYEGEDPEIAYKPTARPPINSAELQEPSQKPLGKDGKAKTGKPLKPNNASSVDDLGIQHKDPLVDDHDIVKVTKGKPKSSTLKPGTKAGQDKPGTSKISKRPLTARNKKPLKPNTKKIHNKLPTGRPATIKNKTKPKKKLIASTMLKTNHSLTPRPKEHLLEPKEFKLDDHCWKCFGKYLIKKAELAKGEWVF